MKHVADSAVAAVSLSRYHYLHNKELQILFHLSNNTESV